MPAEVGAADEAATVNVVAVILPDVSPAVPLPNAKEAVPRREMPVSLTKLFVMTLPVPPIATTPLGSSVNCGVTA